MRVDFTSHTGKTQYTSNFKSKQQNNISLNIGHDKFELSKVNADYKLITQGNTLRLISFKALQDPLVATNRNPSIRLGLENSDLYQENIIATSDIKRGAPIKIRVLSNEESKDLPRPHNIGIELRTSDDKVIGNLPRSVSNAIGEYIIEEPGAFAFNLYGTVPKKQGKPANVLVDIEYYGKKKADVQGKINTLLFKNCVSPDEILHRILDYKKVLYGEKIGTEKIQETQLAINTITNTIKNPKNQKILLIGHNKPDGDTLGCCVGLKAALDYMGKQQVDIAIDDFSAGFLRSIAQTKDIKKSPEFKKEFEKGMEKRASEVINEDSNLSKLSEIYSVRQLKEYYANNIITLNPDEQYDLAIFLDTSSPSRVSPEIKEYAKRAKKVIFIDHHPVQQKEWQNENINNGITIEELKRQHLFWVEPKVPANTELVSVIIDKLLPNLTERFRNEYYTNTISAKDKDNITKMATALSIGTLTDTSGLRRNINRTAEDYEVPREKRTTFAPSGLVDWLLNLTNGEETKRSLKKKMEFDLPNKSKFYFPKDYVDFYNTEPDKEEFINLEMPDPDIIQASDDYNNNIMKRITKDMELNSKVYPEIGLAISQIPYDSLKNFLYEANLTRPEVNMRDIVGAYKFNPVTIALKYKPKSEYYKSIFSVDPRYEENKILTTIRQEEVKGSLNANFHVAEKNSLGFSFRSQEGSDYALILATLFGGGGHNAAAGATVSLPGITFDSKLAVIINGKKETGINKIYQMTKQSFEHNYLYPELPNGIEIKLAIDDDGFEINELIEKMVVQIRSNGN